MKRNKKANKHSKLLLKQKRRRRKQRSIQHGDTKTPVKKAS